jgi:hypothetical protein
MFILWILLAVVVIGVGKLIRDVVVSRKQERRMSDVEAEMFVKGLESAIKDWSLNPIQENGGFTPDHKKQLKKTSKKPVKKTVKKVTKKPVKKLKK